MAIPVPPMDQFPMYVPTAFAETHLPRLHEVMECYSFALLISQNASAPVASHLPLLLEREAGEFGTLVGHMARANPQWKELHQQTVLAVFSGPQGYISPQWYEAENVVPTWNYVAVHACGRLEIIQDREPLRRIVRRMVEVYEQPLRSAWSMPLEATPYEDRMLDQIVGFRIPIESIEGKWKLSQNQSLERRQNVVKQLRKQGDENSLAMAALMEVG